jgi:hypothetical protein
MGPGRFGEVRFVLATGYQPSASRQAPSRRRRRKGEPAVSSHTVIPPRHTTKEMLALARTELAMASARSDDYRAIRQVAKTVSILLAVVEQMEAEARTGPRTAAAA